jgi:hypothetical protein
MILNITYNFFNNKDEKDLLTVSLNNTKIYLISISFYFIIYLLVSLLKNKIAKYILYIIFITDLLGLIINILSNALPVEYSITNTIRNNLKYLNQITKKSEDFTNKII